MTRPFQAALAAAILFSTTPALAQTVEIHGENGS